MVLRLLTGLPAAGLGVALAVPARVVTHLASPADALRRGAAELSSTGVRTAASAAAEASATAVRMARVARNALAPADGCWRAGSRLQLPLRPHPGAADTAPLEEAAEKVAAALLEHPDVLLAYWDGRLSRLVVRATDEALVGTVERRATELAARYGLEDSDGTAEPHLPHPGSAADVRAAAMVLACDAAGIATALTTQVMRLQKSPRLVTAAVTLLREDSRVRDVLRRRLGTTGTDLVLAAVNAATHGLGQSPTALVLDGALRTGQLAEALARAAAFDAAHDSLCLPDRPSLSGAGLSRPPLRRNPGEEYADTAVTGSLVGAAATLVFTRSLAGAAEAVLAGSPKAARYGPTAFTAAVGSALAQGGVLVRSVERLRRLELVDTVVLHPGALRSPRRTVLDVDPGTSSWDHDRLWHAATAALRGVDDAAGGANRPAVSLRLASDNEPADTGLMIASTGGEDIGTVLVGWELDPRAESVLDAARRAGLNVVMVDDPSLGDFASLADTVVAPERPLAEVVRGLQDDGKVVVTVTRIDHEDAGSHKVLAGLLAGDLAVSVTDGRSTVVWDADVLALNGLEGVRRLLAATSAARSVSRRSTVLAQSGTALSGLLVVTGGSPARRMLLPTGVRLSPVNAAAGAALFSGWRAAYGSLGRRAPHPGPRVPWHALHPDEALSRLASMPRTAPTMLSRLRTGADAAARLPVFAPARLTMSLVAAVRAELDDPLTPVLAVGAAASAVLGSTVDALLVTGALGMNAMVGGVQRVRAERALAALAVGQRQTARRITDSRAGATAVVDAARLKPGDLIELATGDVVPADARLLAAVDMEVDESALTGESLPTRKQVAPTPRAAVADRSCMVYEGTTVVAGRGRAVVVGTGDQTQAGRAASLASRAPAAAGVQARLQELTKRVLPLTLAGGAAVTALSLLRGRPVREAVGGGVAVAVAAVPEGLPLVATVAQMAAARRLSRRGVLVRTPRTLEALGRIDTICFDKTGTLTENRLHVVHLVTAQGVTHAANAPEAAAVLQAAARACPRPDETGVHAHATDEAVLAAAQDDPDWLQIDAQPFEASRGYAAALGQHTADGGAHLMVIKGAPEVVLPCCADVPADAEESAHSLASQGLRVLAVARRRLAPDEAPDALDEPLTRLEFLGFVALADTPRAGSAPLVAGLRQAGLRPVILTGDHPQTARAIAVALGWPQDVTVVTGHRLSALDRAGRAELLRDCGVVARVAPEQKLQVIEALREAGRVVAMVGDGANDAAAIRAADVGVGIAARGSAAARNAADLVITGDELSVLVDAVAEGRALWRSVADAISILIGGNFGEVGFTVLGTLLDGASPLSTRQLLLVNLLTDMFPAMAVAVTPQDEEPGEETSLPGDAPVGIAALGAPLTRQIRQRGLVTGLGATTAWLVGRLTPGSARRTSTMALCGVVGAQLTQTIRGRQRSPLVMATAFGSALVLAGIVQTPVVSHFFGCTPLGPVAWTGVGAGVGAAALSPWVLPPAEHLLTRLTATLRPTVQVTR
ncbi:cation-translocating P-type ATPase [Streptomyces sp. WZ-12]|uniref:cation-translocating P-type ATPase n=1 Tax=Streptomyces sp. WZ-12 TaxID=3030210 RepID=UPI0023818DFB|nr:cation-translocating P-type ATPase [Streptomyces sp. WZ-12]